MFLVSNSFTFASLLCIIVPSLAAVAVLYRYEYRNGVWINEICFHAARDECMMMRKKAAPRTSTSTISTVHAVLHSSTVPYS